MITSRSPAAGATVYGLRPYVTMSLASSVLAPVMAADVTVRVAGVDAVVDGIVQGFFEGSLTSNADFGVDVTLRPRVPLESDSWQGVYVSAPLAGIEDGWSFRTVEAQGPRLINMIPSRGADGQATLPLVEFDIVDDTGTVVRRTLAQESNDGELAGSQLTAEGIDFRDALDQLVDIGGTLAFVTAIIGPHIVVTTHSGSGSGLNVKLYKRNGLDVTLAGARVIKTGEVVAGSGWTTTLTQPVAGQWHVSAQKTGTAFAAGDRVDVDVRAQDDNAQVDNVSTLRSHFFVGDNQGPVIGSVSPSPGTRGLSVNQATTQPVFDIIDVASGVDQASINVVVDGVQAITNGVAGGDWASSTVNAVADGYRVTLIKTTAWPGPKTVVVTVDASDTAGNARPTTSWLWHFGAVPETFSATVAGGELVSDDVLRVCSFNYEQTSFAEPVARKHTGYASDGYWYDDGAKDTDVARASWATEATSADRDARDTFPVSGYVAVTAGSWSILDAAGRLWMRCQALGSGTSANWSLAGGVGQALADAAVACDWPMLFLAAGPNLIAVDFAQDKGWRVSAGGKASSGLIATRSSDQAGGAVDPTFALSSSSTPFAAVAGVAFSGSWLAAGARDAQLELAGELTSDYVAAVEAAARGSKATGKAAGVVLLPVAAASGGTWARASARDDKLLAVYTSPAGNARLVTIEWPGVFLYLQSYLQIIDSPLASGEAVVDVDQVTDDDGVWVACVATAARAQLLELDGNGMSAVVIDDLSLADLSLDTVAGGALSAAALAPGFTRARGYLFAAAAAAGDGKVVRYRHQPATASATGQVSTMASGLPVRDVAVLGDGQLARARFVRANMHVLAQDQAFVLASMVLA